MNLEIDYEDLGINNRNHGIKGKSTGKHFVKVGKVGFLYFCRYVCDSSSFVPMAGGMQTDSLLQVR